jgi:hypothetical protein
MSDRPITRVQVVDRGIHTSGFDIAVGLFLVLLAAVMLLHL